MGYHSQLPYQIALTLIEGIGPVRAKSLLAYCGSAEQIFKTKKSDLVKIPDIGEVAGRAVSSADVMHAAEKEARFVEEKNIVPLFFSDKNYPSRLKLCDDGPVLLYTRGKMDLNVPRVISIVGTRSATDYGKSFCESLLKDLQPYNPLVLSGLAFGVDISAHRAALSNKLQTVACVAHGLNKIYPPAHRSTAVEMLNNGGLVSEFVSDTQMSPELFPMRNRLIAGMADCTIVIETDVKGGSVITAQLANGYGREVFALPGRHSDKFSAGCNLLIRKNIAAILTSAAELANYMNWDLEEGGLMPKQLPLFADLSEEELAIIKVLQEKGRTPIDVLSLSSNQPLGKLSGVLLELEFKGMVRSLPGKLYDLV
ncbi:MAG: DNA-processing protein DprA [Flavobacteriales bacterium]